jgi:hypothetical protein
LVFGREGPWGGPSSSHPRESIPNPKKHPPQKTKTKTTTTRKLKINKQQQQQQQQQQLKDLLSNAGKTTQATSSPYDRAAKSQSDSASAWTAMQRSSGDGTGSLEFSPIGDYSIPSSGAEKVAQGWEDAAKTIGSSAIGGMSKFTNKIG